MVQNIIKIKLAHAGTVLQDWFKGFGKTSQGTWKPFKVYLPKCISDEVLSEEQVIWDLKEDDVDKIDIQNSGHCVSSLSFGDNVIVIMVVMQMSQYKATFDIGDPNK